MNNAKGRPREGSGWSWAGHRSLGQYTWLRCCCQGQLGGRIWQLKLERSGEPFTNVQTRGQRNKRAKGEVWAKRRSVFSASGVKSLTIFFSIRGRFRHLRACSVSHGSRILSSPQIPGSVAQMGKHIESLCPLPTFISSCMIEVAWHSRSFPTIN